MRLHITHSTRYCYRRPATGAIQILRLTPRNHDGQYIAHWRIDVSRDCWLHQHEDAFGNITHAFTTDGPIQELAVTAEGEVETRDTEGIIRGSVERFPPGLYLRQTALTSVDENIANFAAACREQSTEEDRLALLHALLDRLNERMTYDTDPTHAGTTAIEAFALKRGVCQDLTHIFIAAARHLAIPARYVGGYFHRADGVTDQEAGHAWAEAFIPELGWVAFDAANGICGTDAHVRVAIGLDYLGAAPLRGTRYGGEGEELAVKVTVREPAIAAWAAPPL